MTKQVYFNLHEVEELRRVNKALVKALRQIAESESDDENQQFRLTRFQSAQVARAALNAVGALAEKGGE